MIFLFYLRNLIKTSIENCTWNHVSFSRFYISDDINVSWNFRYHYNKRRIFLILLHFFTTNLFIIKMRGKRQKLSNQIRRYFEWNNIIAKYFFLSTRNKRNILTALKSWNILALLPFFFSLAKYPSNGLFHYPPWDLCVSHHRWEEGKKTDRRDYVVCGCAMARGER